jgi:hypothetical protein
MQTLHASNLVPRLFSLTLWCHSQKDPAYEGGMLRALLCMGIELGAPLKTTLETLRF